jgi:hypothetical protein
MQPRIFDNRDAAPPFGRVSGTELLNGIKPLLAAAVADVPVIKAQKAAEWPEAASRELMKSIPVQQMLPNVATFAWEMRNIPMRVPPPFEAKIMELRFLNIFALEGLNFTHAQIGNSCTDTFIRRPCYSGRHELALMMVAVLHAR